MTKSFFVASAVLYWAAFLLRLPVAGRQRGFRSAAGALEKAALLSFTTALVLYISALQIVNGQVHSARYDRPVSFLLFAWAICAAQMVSELSYGSTRTAVFSNLWTAISLTLSSASASLMKRVFTNDLEWLSFHRLCFLLGYAFCILGFPLVLSYVRTAMARRSAGPGQLPSLELELRQVDRMSYRMVLWALPLLTAGIVTELLLLMELNRLPDPEKLLTQQQEGLLALTAWLLCGVYLHTRLFFGWQSFRSAVLYLAGLLLLLGGHFSHALLGSAS